MKNPKPIATRKNGKELTASERTGKGRIGFAKEFSDHPQDRVADEESSGKNAVAQAKPCAQNPEKSEKQNPFEHSLVQLRWMTRR